MHSAGYRTNAVLTMAGTMLLVLCFLVASTDMFHRSSPSGTVEIAKWHKFESSRGNDEAVMSFAANFDLSSCFSWNTQQLFTYIKLEYETENHKRSEVTVWDGIVRNSEHARIDTESLPNKYKLVDHGRGLRGQPVNVTLAWNVMPFVGKLSYSEMRFPAHFPKEYLGA